MEILIDSDIERVPIGVLAEAISSFVVADFQGRTTAPPRQAVNFPSGKIVFTSGGIDNIAGFRAYETFRSDVRTSEDQIVAVWDASTCVLQGVCVGTRLGAIRTGALGGIAVNALLSPDVSICAVVGTGLQAETQLLGVLAHRDIREVRAYSRERANRDAFAERMRAVSSMDIQILDNPEEALRGAQIVILATDSETPVVDAAWLTSAQHVTTVGPKYRGAHELPLEVVADRLLVSDSPQQIRDEGAHHMLFGHPRWNEIKHLGEVISCGRPKDATRSLYFSAGLAGTEVIALEAAIAYRRRRS